jgi:hypothetical protein
MRGAIPPLPQLCGAQLKKESTGTTLPLFYLLVLERRCEDKRFSSEQQKTGSWTSSDRNDIRFTAVDINS